MNWPFPILNFKAKIRLVLLVLFTFMTGLGSMGAYHLDRISRNSIDLLNTNLPTLNYTQAMWMSLH